MSNEQEFLRGLANFTELLRRDDFNSNVSKQSDPIDLMPNGTNSLECEFDLQSNEKIIKAFKEIRGQLRDTNKANQALREELNSTKLQLKQLSESQAILTSTNLQLKQRNNQLHLSAEEHKRKLVLLKQNLKQHKQTDEQLQFLREAMVDLKLSLDIAEREKQKMMQISIQEKLSLEEAVNKLNLQRASDREYCDEMEREVTNSREVILKLENQVRELQIKFEEEQFTRKWNKDNHEKMHMQQLVQELQAQAGELAKKNKREKEKRADLQRRVVELEENAGLWCVKAQVYEGQVDCMGKRMRKLQRRMSQAKVSVSRATNDRISWQQKFTRCMAISEELISRVKRELIGDIVELAKTCQYKLSRLKCREEDCKQEESRKAKESVGKENIIKLKQAPSAKKDKSKKKECQNDENELPSFRQTVVKKGVTHDVDSILKTTQKLNQMPDYQSRNKSSHKLGLSQLTFGLQPSPKSSPSDIFAQQKNQLQAKIRRQRDQMQHRLKQKLLFRKIEVANSPERSKMRTDYLRHVLDK